MKEPNDATVEEMRRHFDFFDDDNNGVIDADEFRDLLRIMGDEAAEPTGATYFARINTDEDGRISLFR